MSSHFNKYVLSLAIFFSLIFTSLASLGDRTQFFRNCRTSCEKKNCTSDGLKIQEHAVSYYGQTIFDFTWTCADECQYACVWKTVEAFLERKWQVPQFYGKWPFKRFLGLQEPASVLFSIINFVSHIQMLRKFRKEVRNDSPCYKLWHFFAMVCCNAFLWSTLFHARDFPLTELFDYIFAYSTILVTFYCMIMRMMVDVSLILRALVSLVFLIFFLNYFAYVTTSKFSYSWNMSLNIGTAICAALGWLTWCFFVRSYRPYYKQVLWFFILFGLSSSLEIFDFPPFLWILDAHAAWHLSTIPLVPIFYKFIIEDCQALRKERALKQHSKINKET